MLVSPVLQRTGQKPVRRRGTQRRVPTIFTKVVRDALGRLKHGGLPCPNLRTNAGLDWQNFLLADVYQLNAAQAATSTSVNGISDTVNAPFVAPGLVIVRDITTLKVVYGVIISVANAGVDATIDKWYDPATPGGTAAATPAGTSKYNQIGGQFPCIWMAMSTNATAPAATDTTLAGEVVTADFARAFPTSFSHTASTSTVSIAKTYTATTTVTLNKTALFNAQNGGVMAFESAEPNPPTVVSGDTVAQTATLTYT